MTVHLFTPFQGFSPPFHHLFTREFQGKSLKSNGLNRNLFIIKGAQEYEKKSTGS